MSRIALTEVVRISIWTKTKRTKLGAIQVTCSEHKSRGAVPFETTWINGQLADWNLVGVQPTMENLNRMHAEVVFFLRNALMSKGFAPPCLYPNDFIQQ